MRIAGLVWLTGFSRAKSEVTWEVTTATQGLWENWVAACWLVGLICSLLFFGHLLVLFIVVVCHCFFVYAANDCSFVLLCLP